MGRNVTQQPIPYTPLVAGETIAAGDVISQYASDNKAYTSKYLPFAATANQGSNIYQNLGIANTTNVGLSNRAPILQATDGSIFTLEPNNTSSQGIVLKKFEQSGSLTSSVIVDSSSIAYFNYPKIVFLSSGDIAIVVANNSSGIISYAIYTQNLVAVKVFTATTQTSDVNNRIYVLPSTGGGFTVISLNLAMQLCLITINNSGTITTASTSIYNAFSVNGSISAASLSNGNIALSATSDNTAYKYSVYTTAAASVVPWTNLPSGLSSSYRYTEVAVVTGFFAVAYASTSSVPTIAVFNDAGTQQGTAASPWSTPTLISGGVVLTDKFTTDGTSFYWISGSSAGLKTAKITTAGALTAGPISTGITNSGGLDSYWDTKTSSIVVLNYNNTNAAYTLLNVSASTWAVSSNVTFSAVTFTNSGYGTGSSQAIILGVDGAALVAAYFNVNQIGMYSGSIKPYSSSIIGVAAGAAASGATVYVNSAVGNYATTTATTTIGVKFNHSTAPILGAAGQVFPNTINIQTPTIRNIN